MISMGSVYDHRGRRRYKGTACPLTVLEDLGEVDFGKLVDVVAEKFEKLFDHKRYYARQYGKRTIQRLCQRGMIKAIRQGSLTVYALTAKGRQHLSRIRLSEFRVEGADWDGKWRMLVFDIEEKTREDRNRLRKELRVQGFERLQDSVWVYPYECHEYVALLKTAFRLGDEVLYSIVEKLEGDGKLRKKFRLQIPTSGDKEEV